MHADTLVLKLVLTPLLIAAASLAGRRWGPAVGGWFVGLPLTSGPIALFLALDHGTGFAAAAAVGSLAGALAEAVFCVAYGAMARRGWPVALGAATLGFVLFAALLRRGLLLGLLAFAGFFVVLGATIEPLGVAIGFALATAAALAIQGASLALVLATPESGRLGRILSRR